MVMIGFWGLVLTSGISLAQSDLIASTTSITAWSVKDSWLEESHPTNNHGNEKDLKIKNKTGDRKRAIYQFNLSGIDPGSVVTSAVAQFFIQDKDNTGLPVNVYRITDSWTELGVNWSNTGSDYDSGRVYGTFVPDDDGFLISVDLTDLVQEWIFGTHPNYGLMLIPTSVDEESKYKSKEEDNPDKQPRLHITTTSTAELELTKTVDDANPNENDIITYTITLTNNGPDNGTGIQVSDLLPVGITYFSSTPSQGTYNSGSGVWSVGALLDGASANLTLRGTVNGGSAGSSISNSASVISLDQADPVSGNDSDGIDILVKDADLSVSKTVDQATPDEGQTVTYTVSVSNNGPDDGSGIEITDLLPAGLTYVSSTPSQGSYNSGTGVWTVGGVASGAGASMTLTATVDAGTAGSTITNTASVTAATEGDSNGGNNSDSVGITVRSVDLSLTKTVDNSAPDEGDTIVYTVALSNNGPGDGTGIAVTDQLPAGVTYVSSTPSQGSYDSGTGVWAVGDVANGAGATLTLTATVDAGTGGATITNTATVTAADQADSDSGNDSDSVDIIVTLVDLQISKSVDDPSPDEGETIAYTLTLTNNGPDDGTGIAVTDLLPGGVTFVSATPSQGSYDSGTGIWTVGNVASAASATLTLTATVDASTLGDTITNTAAVTASDQADSDSGNDSDTADITVTSADPSLIPVECLVYHDLNGDGDRQAEEPGLPDIRLMNGVEVFTTDADGRLDIVLDREIFRFVCMTIPAGFWPSNSWYHWVPVEVTGRDSVAFGLRDNPATASDPVRFVHIGDTQITTGVYPLAADLQAMNRLADRPAFIFNCGDLVNDGWNIAQWEYYVENLAVSEIPVFSVSGNHEIYGLEDTDNPLSNYEEYAGPPYYSFEVGSYHLIAYNNLEVDGIHQYGASGLTPYQDGWLADDVAAAPPRSHLLLFQHVMARDTKPATLSTWNSYGILGVFSGHWHSNLFAQMTSGIKDFNVARARGGPHDRTPRVFNIVSGDGFGEFELDLRRMLIDHRSQVAHPQPGSIVRGDNLDVIVQTYDSASAAAVVTADITAEGGSAAAATLTLDGISRWRAGVDISHLPPGECTVHVTGSFADGQGFAHDVNFLRSSAPATALDLGDDWPMLRRTPSGESCTPRGLYPPLELVWSSSVAGMVALNSPVVADGRVFMGARTEKRLEDAGVSAFDALGGQLLWRTSLHGGLALAPAAAAGVVIATAICDSVYGLSALDGEILWSLPTTGSRYDLTAPIFDGDYVWVSGEPRSYRVNWATGQISWSSDHLGNIFQPFIYSAPALGPDFVYYGQTGVWHGTAATAGGFSIVDRQTGALEIPTENGIFRSPICQSDTVYVAGALSPTEQILTARDALGNLLWSAPTPLGSGTASPALAHGIVVVPGLNGAIEAMRAADGFSLWSQPVGYELYMMKPGVLVGRETYAAPAIADSVVYVGSLDGYLYALDLFTGEELWKHDFGVPVASSAAISGNMLFVGASDGHLYAFRGQDQRTLSAAVSDIEAAPDHTRVQLSWANPEGLEITGTEIWRSLWRDETGASAYPEYDDVAAGTIPARPASHAAAAAGSEWTLVGTTEPGISAFTDTVSVRGVYYYEVFAIGNGGAISQVALDNDRATNYRLGDFNGTGTVDTADLSIFGFHYGLTAMDPGYSGEIDIGPTDDNSGAGVPLTDDSIDFEDLMIISANYTLSAAKRTLSGSSDLSLAWLRTGPSTWSLQLVQPCASFKGLRLTAPVLPQAAATVVRGSLLDAQPEAVFLQNSARQGLDVGLAILGSGAGITGAGELLRVLVPEGCDVGQPLILARSMTNEVLAVELKLTDPTGVPLPLAFALGQNYPNPFNPLTRIGFELPSSVRVKLIIYSLDGKRVVTLVDEALPAGRHEVFWNGRNSSGQPVASGAYFYRLDAGSFSATRRMLLVR